MDSNTIGGNSWQNLTPLSGPSAQRQAPAPASTQPEEVLAAPSDAVQLSSTSAAPVAEQAPAFTPQAEVQAQPRAEAKPSQVPVSLIDDGSHSQIGSGLSASAHPTSGLGVIAELHETSAVRAIGDDSGNNRFAGLHLVGPANAAQYLGNPGGMYLGI